MNVRIHDAAKKKRELTIPAQQWKVLRARTVVVNQGGNMRSVRVDGGLLRQQIL